MAPQHMYLFEMPDFCYIITCCYHSLSVIVLAPGVRVTSLSDSVDAGINLTLACTIDLSEMFIDTVVEIHISWSASGVTVSTSSILSDLGNSTSGPGLLHISELPLGVLVLGSSDGVYTCDAGVDPFPESAYILFSARRSDSIRIATTGER